MSRSSSVPDLLPILSRGKHRGPKRGACFMEMASVLAGERWSDHPRCTHPLLAEVARNVNDRTSDEGRQRLALLIPAVIGATTDRPDVDARIALRCAVVALPVAPQEAQRALAVGVSSCLRELSGADCDELRADAARVLAEVPDAARWASRFAARSELRRPEPPSTHFRRYAAPGIVTLATRSAAEGAGAARDTVLVQMLEGALAECLDVAAPAPVELDDERWRQVCAQLR